MKKLSLKKLNLEANDMLQRNQLKTVFGGYGEYSNLCTCKTNGTVTHQGYVTLCDACGDFCTYGNPSHTSWICT